MLRRLPITVEIRAVLDVLVRTPYHDGASEPGRQIRLYLVVRREGIQYVGVPQRYGFIPRQLDSQGR